MGRSSSALILEHVTRVFEQGSTRRAAVDDVSLELQAATMVAIVGHSGSGKSTLLNIAGGLESPTAGEVILAGVPLRGLSPRKLASWRARTTAFIFQEYNLIRNLTVLENVCLPLEFRGTARRHAIPRAQEALARVGVESHAAKYPDQLSGGEQQRVAISRAIVGEPALILADEPTGALDTATGAVVVTLLREMTDDGSACLVVTHNREVAAAADRVITLRDGAVVTGEE